jgi:glutamine amidotransferase
MTVAAPRLRRDLVRRWHRVVIADYGAGNLRSLVSALRRSGVDPVITTAPRDLRDASLVVIAGVGSSTQAARGLERAGLIDALRERAHAGRPLFGICIGLQLLFEDSEEGGRGLGLVRGSVVRLRAARVPHMGWNALRPMREAPMLERLAGADVYFAHSYAAVPADERVVAAVTDHGGRVVAAVVDGPVAGVQFHPERSGAAGARLLDNVLAWSRSV